MKIAEFWQKLKEVFRVRERLILFYTSLFFIIFSVGIGSGYLIFKGSQNSESAVTDPYIVFIGEIYDTVKTNYWEKITDENLSNIFELGAEKVSAKPQVLKIKNKSGVEKWLMESSKRWRPIRKKSLSFHWATLSW